MNKNQTQSQIKGFHLATAACSTPLATAFAVLTCAWQTGASASTYRSIHDTTVLVLDESTAPGTPLTGFYHTKIYGNFVLGRVVLQKGPADATSGMANFTGTFSDVTFSPGGVRKKCSGNISLNKAATDPLEENKVEPGAGLQFTDLASLSVFSTWNLLEGEGCFQTNSFVTLQLSEILPQANAQGEFSSEQSNTWRSETSGDITWPVWTALSSSGLACTTEPGSTEVVFTYASQAKVEAETRAGNALFEAGAGQWFLRTRKSCYVRASNAEMAPVSVPERMLRF